MLAVRLLIAADGGGVEVVLLGNWQAPFGIALVLDRLAALMLVLTAAVALPALLYAGPRFASRAPHFHAFFQFQLAGLNGAFLTADLFNLFVCFELLLIASYALLLHGAGAKALGAGFRYVVVNLVASSLFLVAASLLYGVAGTLNLADLARKLPALGAENLGLARAAGLHAAGRLRRQGRDPAARLLAPVGLPQCSGPGRRAVRAHDQGGRLRAPARDDGHVRCGRRAPSPGLGQDGLFGFGLATIVVGAVGAWAVRRVAGLAAFLVTMSAGTLVAAIALPGGGGIGGAVFYLAHSAFVGAALFLVADAVAERRGEVRDRLLPGPAPAQPTLWGLLFLVTAVAIAGIPPLSGFLGKYAMLAGTVDARGAPWFWGVVLATSLIATMALARAGSIVFWDPQAPAPAAAPRMQPAECAAILLLLAYSAALVLFAGPAQRYAGATAEQLATPQAYVDAVLGTQPVAKPPARGHR